MTNYIIDTLFDVKKINKTDTIQIVFLELNDLKRAAEKLKIQAIFHCLDKDNEIEKIEFYYFFHEGIFYNCPVGTLNKTFKRKKKSKK